MCIDTRPPRCSYDSAHDVEYHYIISPKVENTSEPFAFAYPPDQSERVLGKDVPEIKGSHVLTPLLFLVCAILVGREFGGALQAHYLAGMV